MRSKLLRSARFCGHPRFAHAVVCLLHEEIRAGRGRAVLGLQLRNRVGGEASEMSVRHIGVPGPNALIVKF